MKVYSIFDLEQIRIKKMMFELHGISNYLMQDYENDNELTEFQQSWKVLHDMVDFLMKLMPEIYNFKWNELKFTDRELKIMKERKNNN